MSTDPMRRRHAIALASAALLTSLGADAAACHLFRDEEGTAFSVACFTSLHAAVATAVFAPADIYYAAHGRWPPPTWAWSEVALGGVATVTGGAVAIGLAADQSPHPAVDIGWSVGLIAAGGFYLTHGVLSLLHYRPPAAEAATSPAGAAGLMPPSLAVVPVDGGAMALVSF